MASRTILGGRVPRDQQGYPIPTATSTKHEDERPLASGGPQISPLISGPDGAPGAGDITLTVPAGALFLHARAKTSHLAYGEGTLDGAATGKGYCLACDGEWVVIPVSRFNGAAVYLRTTDMSGRAQGSHYIEFFFEMLDSSSD